MKLPRDLSGRELAQALQVLGYRVTRQIGSHLRLTTTERREHHLTVPDHDSLRLDGAGPRVHEGRDLGRGLLGRSCATRSARVDDLTR